MSSSTPLPGIDEEIEVGGESATDRANPYHLILLDDNEHTPEYVIEMLMELLDFSLEKSRLHMLEVHNQGHSRLGTMPLAEAERKRDAIHSYGPDRRATISRGAMAALIEPAASEN